MGKRLTFPTRAFGSDGVRPDTSTLASWISRHRGHEADITSFLLEQELSFQQEAGLDIPCAGGRFSFESWQKYLTGIDSGEMSYDAVSLARDVEVLTSIVKGVWLTIPAPHLLHLPIRPSRDPDEALSALHAVYNRMMRAGRDHHLAGHVLFCERALKEELDSFSGRKVFFFTPEMNKKSLSLFLEYQQSIALKPALLPVLQDVMGEYEVSRIILLDPAGDDLRNALSIKDPDQIMVGGYCPAECDSYWKKLVERSSLVTGFQQDRQTV